MRDGFYLSTYSHIDELANLTNTILRHDHNISLWEKTGNNIKLVHYWELERVSGLKKHNISFYNVDQAKKVINSLLKEYNLTLEEMVEIWGTPGIETCKDYSSLMEYPDFTYHSIAHLFSAVLFDTEIFKSSNIIGLAVDGGSDDVIDFKAGSKNCYAGCFVRNGNIDMFNVSSPGAIWFHARVRYNMQQGTLMALGSASDSVAHIETGDVLEIKNINDIVNSLKWFNEIAEKIESLTENDVGVLFSGFDPKFSIMENKISMVMKIVQNMSYRIMEKNIEEILEKYNVDPAETYLAVAGGFALNCPANSHMMEKYKFKGFIAPACVSDTGMSLGIALYAFSKKCKDFEFCLKHAYYGDRDNNLDKIINDKYYSEFIKCVSQIKLEEAVNDLINAPIVWFDGRAEIGPRALGSRSILADPRVEASKDKLNIIKKREWWRPVAPIVLKEDVDKWFENAYHSPFMLHTFKIIPDKVNLVPAIAHIDNTARVQTIKYEDSPLLYNLIAEFKKVTGVPIICNTSLNDKGEPIINRIEEAINFALRKKIGIIYVNGNRIELVNHDKFKENSPKERPVQIRVYKNEDERNDLLDIYNPSNLPNNIIKTYYATPELRNKFRLTNKIDAERVSKIAKFIKAAGNYSE